MAKKRSKKSKQQRRQAATAERNQRRAKNELRHEADEETLSHEPLSPGDRVNALLAAFGKKLDANPFAARGVALVIDYLLCGILVMIPLSQAFNAVGGGRVMRNLVDLAAAGMGMGALAGVVAAAFVISFIYYVVVPFKVLPGQTPGKYLTHLEVVMLDGTPATLTALGLRWAFMTLCETMCTFASTLAIQYLTLLAGEKVGNAYTAIGAVATVVTVWLVWRKGANRRALHDLVAGTWVYANVQ